MKNLLILLQFFIYANSDSGIASSENIRIVAKYEVADWDSQMNFNYCSGEVKAFLKMGQFDCGYTINGREVYLREKIWVDPMGRLKEFFVKKN
ncbi:MAG: hypothetical protein AAF694_19105 [Bacteroidota bacterium]